MTRLKRTPATEQPEEETGGTASRIRRFTRPTITVLAWLLLLAALILPNDLNRLTPVAFLRIPVEALIAMVLILVAPRRVSRWGAVAGGVLVGLVTILKVADMGFYKAFERPFDLLSDWTFLSSGIDLLAGQLGRAGAIAAVIGIGILAVGVVVLMVLSALRVTRVVAGHRTASTRAVAVLGVVWLVCAVVGVEIAPGQPIAARSAGAQAYNDTRQVVAELRDHQAFAAEAAVDAYRDTPGNQLLTALRGKDVLLTFVESYGRVAVQDSDIAPAIDKLLDDGTSRLRAAGYSARSGFLTSSTAGGGSWLAHSTLQSGLWVNSQQRYDNLMTRDRLTLSSAFHRAGWQTVHDVPAHFTPWPEGKKFYGFDRYYDAPSLGYKGPFFSYAPMPDQFILSKFQQAERAAPHAPMMAEVDLVSSHWPWAPLPRMIGWNDLGDGSVYGPIRAQSKSIDEVWKDSASVRAAYGESIQYSLNTLISYVENYGDDNLVLVFLGDHQPNQAVTGENASKDVPITIVARDPAVLDRISTWGWTEGLRPSPQAPVWPMNTFRDKFLAAYSR
ncbi:MAG TPA: sulfatase-like hydrolase/transferase [Amycolatopsis sp.]|uniref:sulfatase-like hydrolase/transferase n=1 Tax=Amycolatopsis sp. TaxID=37632 RepID=UPI002B48A9E1|nr:sulfatase-like hydrolase/transferase [Amycolatopsis sp.]HKS44841.1 sulfatase-like hydrolase/transferase [Amycolatopsis sp.]